MLSPLQRFVIAGTSSRAVLTFIVIPCLNEVGLIGQAVSSLGFGPKIEPRPDTHLIVVDNGSTDGTLELLDAIAWNATGPVHVFREVARGYVPPRHRGVSEASRIASDLGQAAHDVLILQADADTIYKPNYVAAMNDASSTNPGAMLEGAISRPRDFETEHPDYVRAERAVDEEVETLDAEDVDEVILDDKVCGYRLSDYLSWGGLFEEHTTEGDAIHAETTRMFIRAKVAHSAAKLRVNPAGAQPSRRRVAENPWLHYATVGFPREASWGRAQRPGRQIGPDVDEFAQRVLAGRESRACFLRRAHQLALFRYLPAYVSSVLQPDSQILLPPDVRAAIDVLPERSIDNLWAWPGRAMIDVLRLIDEQPEIFA